MLQTWAEGRGSGSVGAASSHPGRDSNQTAGHRPAAGALQTQDAPGKPADEAEREAERVSERVTRTLEPPCACGGSCPRCQTGAIGHAPVGLHAGPVVSDTPGPHPVPPIVHEVLRSPGRPLEPATRAFLEPAFGYDLGRVRVHADERAAASARAVNARAYTVGDAIVFAAGQFQPRTAEGRHLLAHELTHVVQQSHGAYQLQRWADCTPARMSLQECPPREPGETERATSGPMVFLPTLRDPRTRAQGVLIANFDIGSSKIKPNLHETLYWKQFLARIAVNRSQWRIAGFTDCQGADGLNQQLREERAAAVFKILPPEIQSRIVSQEGAPLGECITENSSAAERTLNRSVALILETSVVDFKPEQITARCIPPEPRDSPGKHCKFYVYDSTEPTGMAWKWKAAALALATPRPGAYVIPSGKNIEEALKGIFDTYASKDCDCTEEVQFWSHGSPGNAMSITESNDELTIKDFEIPDLKKFGYGPTSLPGYREWNDKLTTRQRRLVLLRRTICDPDAEIYYRSCEAFQGKKGQEFAKASTEFWGSKVVGHTKVIALTQPGKKELKPCQEPFWPESEGTGEPSPKKPVGIGADQKPKKD
jgi:outer membrane protein OmpA-like peptidoglycan-associated protein